MSSPSEGSAGSPGAETPSSGQGFGLRWQKRRKSAASSLGKMATLPCTERPAMPLVGPVHSPERIRFRASDDSGSGARNAVFIRSESYFEHQRYPAGADAALRR